MTNSGLTVLTNPHPELRRVSAAVTSADLASKETQAFIDQLEIAMREFDGVGIAAPQVGDKRRIIVALIGGRAQTFVNPELVSKSFRTAMGEEGCLSVPGVYGLVKRCRTVKVKALTRDGAPVELDCGGLEAVIFQHEIDHLDGILFIDKVEKFTSAGRSKL